MTEFYTRGNGREVTAVMNALAPDKFSCIPEVIACMKTGATDTYRVSITQKRSFWSGRIYERALVLDYLDNHVFESKRQVAHKPKPFNIAQVIG